MRTLAVPLLLLATVALAWAEEPKKVEPPKLPLGRDTTFVVGPFDKQGFIDYEAALNAEMSKGITVATNANVLLVQVFGPAPEGGEGLPLEYFRWLDIDPLPKDGAYFLGTGDYVVRQLGLGGERLEAFYEFQGRASQRPWAAKDCEPLAAWLKVNDKQLAVVVEATKRPHYFNPMASRREPGGPSNLIGSLLPTVQKCRELASSLSCRAMLKLHEGKLDEAWADLLACHRLGRLVSHGGTLIELLVGVAITQIAHNSTHALLDHPKLTAEMARACLRDVQALPKFATVADKIGMCERMVGLDALQMIRRGMPGELSGLLGEDLPVIAPGDQKKALELMDWATVMQTMNKRYDQMEAAARLTDRAARLKAFDKLDDEFKNVKKEFADEKAVKKLLDGKDPGKTVGRALGEVLMSLLAPAVNKVMQAQDRAEQSSRNLEVAFALAIHFKETGKYPAKLADLAPKYLKEVPNDRFSGKPLIYKPADKGYLFYSVGMNETDDGGATFGEDPPGDDLRVKIPLPPLKKK